MEFSCGGFFLEYFSIVCDIICAVFEDNRSLRYLDGTAEAIKTPINILHFNPSPEFSSAVKILTLIELLSLNFG